MHKPNDGGPAFPVITSEPLTRQGVKQEVTFHTSTGLSLRDWFAGQALIGLLTAYGPHMVRDATDGALLIRESICTTAYTLAASMLAAREGK